MSLASLIKKQEAKRAAQANQPAANNPLPTPTPTPKPTPKFSLKAKAPIATESKPEPEAAEGNGPSPKESAVPQESHQPETPSPLPGETPATNVQSLDTSNMEEGMAKFYAVVQRVPELHDDPDMLGQMLRRIMNDLKENPEYMEILAPGVGDGHVNAILQGFKKCVGTVQIKKETTRKKTSNRKKSPALSGDMMNGLNEMLAGLQI